MQLTELCSVTSQICTNGIACSSVNPSQPDLAPVPLSIFRSNSKFDENSELSNFECTRSTTTIFCTLHDSDTVVTCAKYRCDRSYRFYTRVLWIFIEFDRNMLSGTGAWIGPASNVNKLAPVYVAENAEAAFLTGQDQHEITNRQWNFKVMCALKTNPCDRHKVTVSSLLIWRNWIATRSKLKHGPPCRVDIQGSVSLKFATK